MYLKVENVNKSFESGHGQRVQVLKEVSTELERGQMCVICGPSGSGKSTFLHVIGALTPVDSGRVTVDGEVMTGKNPKQLSWFRRQTMGFIFQFYHLIPNLTVQENVQVCQYLSDAPLNRDELIETLGLTEHQHKFPSQLSGGQQQRCAIARALVKNPKLLLCDEPTGALDSENSREILSLLDQMNQRYHTTMLIVTHNEEIRKMVHRVIRIRDGQIHEDYINQTRISPDDLKW